MALFLAFLPNSVARARLSSTLERGRNARAGHQVRWAGSWEEMHQFALGSGPRLAVFDPYASGVLDIDACAAFGSAFPSIALLAYGNFRPGSYQDVLHLGRVGACGVAAYDVDDSPALLGLLITEILSFTVVGEVLEAIEDLVPSEIMPVMRYLLSPTDRSVTPETAAGFYRRCPKTLGRHLRSAGLPPLNKMILWARLFQAAHLLRDQRRTVEQVAYAAGFPSRTSFYNQLGRYACVTPTELTRREPLHFLLAEFRRRHGEEHWTLYGGEEASEESPGE